MGQAHQLMINYLLISSKNEGVVEIEIVTSNPQLQRIEEIINVDLIISHRQQTTIISFIEKAEFLFKVMILFILCNCVQIVSNAMIHAIVVRVEWAIRIKLNTKFIISNKAYMINYVFVSKTTFCYFIFILS